MRLGIVAVSLGLAFACAVATAMAPASAQEAAGRDGYDVTSGIPLVSRAPQGSGRREETIDADLFRSRRTGRLPAVVITPSSGGVAGHVELFYARLLAQHGMAALVVDSFTPRGILNTVQDQSQLSLHRSNADAVAGHDWLAKQDFVDPQRIVLLGMSKGAVVANRLAMLVFLEQQRAPDLRFAAHVAIAPSCLLQSESAKTTGAPIFMMLAEEDDYTPIKPCLDYIAKIRAVGNRDVRFAVYPGVTHGYEWTGGRIAAKVELWTCEFSQRNAGAMVDRKTNRAFPNARFDQVTERNKCIEKNAAVHVGGDQRVRDQAVGDLLQFLRDYDILRDDDVRAVLPDCATVPVSRRENCQRARAGWIGDLVRLARAYRYGQDGVAVDLAAARRMFQIAADRGQAQAQWELGFMLYEGAGVPRDDAAAKKLLLVSAQAGEAPAMNLLGNMARAGRGGPADAKSATDWFRRGAELRHPWAMAHYGKRLVDGDAVTRDVAAGLRLVRLSAFRGNPLGQLYLGEALLAGTDLPKDVAQAQRLLQAASAQKLDLGVSQRADEVLKRLETPAARQ
jgi:dienelactone hydrolase